MSVTAEPLPAALQELGQALDGLHRPGTTTGQWRWRIRRHLAAVRDLLIAESSGGADGWTAAREGSMLRERNALLGRVGILGAQVLEHPEVEVVLAELRRLLTDLGRHVQRVNDLAYDTVELELGGSE